MDGSQKYVKNNNCKFGNGWEEVSLPFKTLDEFEEVIKEYIFPILGVDKKTKFKDYTHSNSVIKKGAKKYVMVIGDVGVRKNGKLKKSKVVFSQVIGNDLKLAKKLNKCYACSIEYSSYALKYNIKTVNNILMAVVLAKQSTYLYFKNINSKLSGCEEYYMAAIYRTAVNIGIAMAMGCYKVFGLYNNLQQIASRLYENNHLPYGFIFDNSRDNGKTECRDFLFEKYLSVITDGFTSFVWLDKNGRVIEYDSFAQDGTTLTLPNSGVGVGNQTNGKGQICFAPLRFMDFCEKCEKNKIGVILQRNGDVLFFKNRALCIVSNGNELKIISPVALKDCIVRLVYGNVYNNGGRLQKKYGELVTKIVLSLLDTAFARTGGCLAILDDVYFNNVCEHKPIKKGAKLLVDESYLFKGGCGMNGKSKMLKDLVGSSVDFQSLNRKFRQELLALDGAMIISKDGEIATAGAIINISHGSPDGGARTSAAKELSKYGVAIKISMDGKISVYKNGNEIISYL